jgi:tetratricopeptide (TPR) repeat protein
MLRARKSVQHTTACRPEAYWTRLAAGSLTAEEAENDLLHAAQCEICGPFLRNAVECFSDEIDPEDAAVVAGLKTSSSSWQDASARRLAGYGLSGRRRWALAWAAGIVLAVGSGLWWTSERRALADTQRLLAEGYTENRPMELRLPGAAYSPVRLVRGAPQSVARPTSLLKAELRIGEALKQRANAPRWLNLRGRAEMIEGNADAAVHTLEAALGASPDDAEILADLGTAYAQRAWIETRPTDDMTAIEMFGRSLQQRPGAPYVVFNQALACEQIKLYERAIAEWQRYLSIDPSGPWAAEARARLDELHKKKP